MVEIKPGDALWITGGVFMTISAVFNLLAAIGNYIWSCVGFSIFGWEMDAVYGKLFFTYQCVPFSKLEGTCALCMAIGGFMSWVEDPTIQMVALLLQVVGCGYWLICAFYGALIRDVGLIILPTVFLGISLGSAFTRGPGYVFREEPGLETPFYVITGIILGMSYCISLAAVATFDDEKKALVEKLGAVKAYCAENKGYSWPVENSHKIEDAPDGFYGDDQAKDEEKGIVEPSSDDKADRTEDAVTADAKDTGNAGAAATESAGNDAVDE